MIINVRKFVLGLITLLAIGFGYGGYLFFKRPPDIRTEKPEIEISAEELSREFSADETIATAKYTGKVLLVRGTVNEITTGQTDVSVSLVGDNPMNGVTCSFYPEELNNLKKIKQGSIVRIKGKCTGVLTDVILNNCSIVTN